MERRTIARLAPWQEMRKDFTWNIPDHFNIAVGCCDSWAETAPDRPAIIDLSEGRQVWSYGELKDASDRLAGALARAGVGRGDRVAILLPQRAEVMVAHFAAMKLGAVSLPLFGLFGPDALAYRLRDSGARAVIGDGAGLAKLAALDLPDLALRLDVDDWDGALDGPPLDLPVATAADDPAMMIYTSGTTGAPKGVLHAHRFLFGHLPCVETSLEGFPQPADVAWTPADWAWIGGLMDLAMPALWFGVPLVARRFAKFDPEEAWALMRQERVTASFLPPTALKMLRRSAGGEGLALRAIMSGGEALGAELLDWGRAHLGVAINEIYGQTECNLVMAACAGTLDVVPGTLGRAVPGVEVAVLDSEGRPVADGAVGEICTRGSPAMFLRYWNKPEQTTAKWRNGWLRTGDLARVDGAEVTYVSRDDDVITSAGYRIGPTEIETCLMAHPSVTICAVVGLPDAQRGEVVTAFVVATEQRPELEDELMQWVRDRLSPHMAPRRVHMRDSLPMTATGKIQRRALREAANG